MSLHQRESTLSESSTVTFTLLKLKSNSRGLRVLVYKYFCFAVIHSIRHVTRTDNDKSLRTLSDDLLVEHCQSFLISRFTVNPELEMG